MIFVKNTAHYAGVEICGDRLDFDNLYESLHALVGGEGEFGGFEAAGTRVLGVCYDLRHALMGDRDVEFVDNGLDAEMKRRMAMLAPDKNVYFRIQVLWPEMLFVMMALNDFVRLSARKKAKKSYDMILDKHVVWDGHIAATRFFQAAVIKCLKDTVSAPSFSRMMNVMNKDYPWMDDYTRQYVDVLNCKFIEMDSEKRLKNIPAMAKRLADQGEDYWRLREGIQVAARKYNTDEDNINPPIDYPDDFEW